MDLRTAILSLLLCAPACDGDPKKDGDPKQTGEQTAGGTTTSSTSDTEVTSTASTETQDGSDTGSKAPCDDLAGGTIPETCSSWIAAACGELAPEDCDGQFFFATPAGELGCAVAGSVAAGNSCQPGEPLRCVAGLHAGDGGQTLYFEGEEVLEILCEQMVPCPAFVLGHEPCGAAGAPDVCGCAPGG